MIEKYPWLNTIYNKILHSYYIKKGHHAWLFNCTQDNGEDILINRIICWLFCISPNKKKSCNICYSCNLINKGQHPDYYQLNSEENYVHSIGIDAVRSCINSIYMETQYSNVKVIFIRYAENLTREAMYALLKILEDPPINTYFFLKVRELTKISNSLLSRCIKWFIPAPTEEEGLQWLLKYNNVNNDNDILLNKIALRLCSGSPIAAQSILNSDIWNYRLELYKVINNAVINKDFLKILDPLSKKNYDNMSIRWLIILIIDTLKWKHKVQMNFIINIDQLELISTISTHWNMLSLHNQLQQWLMLFYYLKKFDNINRELLVTCRLLNWEKNIIEYYL